jgi:hypothetical protein
VRVGSGDLLYKGLEGQALDWNGVVGDGQTADSVLPNEKGLYRPASETVRQTRDIDSVMSELFDSKPVPCGTTLLSLWLQEKFFVLYNNFKSF